MTKDTLTSRYKPEVYLKSNKFSCRICKSTKSSHSINFGKHPIVHNLCRLESNYDSYPFELTSCERCGFIQLLDPISPEILYKNYFTVSSWKNQPHVHRLIEVIEAISLISKSSNILDVGCNDGSFLDSLKSSGYSNLSGIEPTEDASNLALLKGFNVQREFLTESIAHSKFEEGSYDLITTRQVLEHIIDLDDYMQSLKYLLSERGTLVIEIPDSEWNLECFDYALWEEHANYFTLSTVSQLLKQHGFTIIHYEVTLFSGRALTVFCQKMKEGKKPSTMEFYNYDEIKIKKFFGGFEKYKSSLHQYLRLIDKPIAVYGSGARSSNFVNFNEVGSFINCFVDDQIEKQNLFVPGCDLEIVPYDNAQHSDYFFLLGVNAENERKVIQNRGLKANSYASILPPSVFLPDFWLKLLEL
jgi:2-polyprenyl-3-methyl-5-hydroxy-6-metoxy-1,4-benzoquinol methylase